MNKTKTKGAKRKRAAKPKKKAAANKAAAAQKVSPETARLEALGIAKFCDNIIDGRSLRSIARSLDISPGLVLKWIEADPERRRLYTVARAEQAEALASDIIEIADEAVPCDEFGKADSARVQDKRVRIDSRKWVAAKLKPQVYGDKLDLSGSMRVELTPEQCQARAAVLLAKLGIVGPMVSVSEVLAKLGVTGKPGDEG